MAEKLTLKSLNEKINILTNSLTEAHDQIDELKETIKNLNVRDRGPKSTRMMNEDDARRIMLGDLKDVSHKQAAKELGLSYAQVYSARGGYTFKNIMNEKISKKK